MKFHPAMIAIAAHGLALVATLILIAMTRGRAILSPEATMTLEDMVTGRILWPTFTGARGNWRSLSRN